MHVLSHLSSPPGSYELCFERCVAVGNASIQKDRQFNAIHAARLLQFYIKLYILGLWLCFLLGPVFKKCQESLSVFKFSTVTPNKDKCVLSRQCSKVCFGDYTNTHVTKSPCFKTFVLFDNISPLNVLAKTCAWHRAEFHQLVQVDQGSGDCNEEIGIVFKIIVSQTWNEAAR